MTLNLAQKAADAVDKQRLVKLCQDLIQIRSVYEEDNHAVPRRSQTQRNRRLDWKKVR